MVNKRDKKAIKPVVEGKLTKSQQREADKLEKRASNKVEKGQLEEKYDANLQHSDDSSDEEVLLRTGDIP